MKKIVYGLLIILLIIFSFGCKKQTYTEMEQDNNEVIDSVKAIINDKEYIINLENNNTSLNLVKLFPITLSMEELNGNEKYAYLDVNLPTNSYNPQKINAGDVMLYGDNCLVIFYKTFDTPYSYTKIGHIDNLPDLGNDNITVRFEK